ncbi:type I polyketide synthase [Chelatococcus reniformis]|uniref:Polyketide synthase n=1 Tax=Chelatococcus reniformis TaxID=1494448 RepID=A0A916UMV1_9HYPH|nr:type I polyketide synthase [Chelatococcus reniformis]GGC78327.1 polyketide synthase [Chelatococcus reniformis]
MNGPVALSNLTAVQIALMAEDVRDETAPILRADPVAVVGMACRAPGGSDSPAALWRLLAAGSTTTGEIPGERFDVAPWFDPDPDAPGKLVTRRGSFLDRIDLFDAEYFGILGREADQMDPQQRLTLETAIEAIDDAGVVHAALRGARAGVFMACYHSDYARLVYRSVGALDTRTLTGTVHGVVANRISHVLDLRGPSLTLDTGCSSSLVAIHLACQSLRLGETDFALAGGASVMITPELFVAMTKLGFMAPDGQCKTFDAAADGFGRGEGCGVVALKRLSDAVADGDRVLAVIRGSAVNQDGRSTVLTAPNGQAQQALVHEALTSGGVTPERISFVEAHGTGTALGDPIEVEALASALGAGRPHAPPCYLGSAKANIGHLEAAAGVIGLIKTVEALRRGQIPPQPNFKLLNPHISLEHSRLRIPVRLTPFPAAAAPRCAAVSSFGIGGTNGHVVLEEAPMLPGVDPAPEGAVWTLPLSAKTPAGLATLASAWLDLLDAPESAPIADLCHTAARRRSHYAARLAVVGKDKAALRRRLSAALEAAPTPLSAAKPRIGFVFCGQGTQWFAMGRELMASHARFLATMEACDRAIAQISGWSVIEELRRPEECSRLGETAIAQPALFALQTALAATWACWGIRPAAVVGHSVGEIAALHVAGALSLEEAARIVVRRGAIMQAATGLGRMAAVALTEADARALVARFDGRIDIGAVNAPGQTVLSGEAAALDAAIEELAGRNILVRPLHVDYAFHSAQMRPLAERFAAGLGPVESRDGAIPIVSTVTGADFAGRDVDAAYLTEAICKPVRFAAAIGAMADAHVDVFVEVGPHPALAAAIGETLGDGRPHVVVASLRRGRDDTETMHQSLAALYAAGVDPDWSAVQPADGQVTTLPAYPWQRRRHWIADSRPALQAQGDWLGAPAPVAGTDLTIIPLDPQALGSWVDDHRVFDEVILPGAAIIQALAGAAGAVSQGRAGALAEVLIREPLRVGVDGESWQIVAAEVPNGWTLAFHARAGTAPWRLVAEARSAVPAAPSAQPPETHGRSSDLVSFYGALAGAGFAFGPAFRILEAADVSGSEAQGWAALPDGTPTTRTLHPTLLDAGFQLATLAAGVDGAYLPMSVEHAELWPAAGRTLRLHARVTAQSDAALTAEVTGYDESGACVAKLTGVHFVKPSPQLPPGHRDRPAELYSVDWIAAEQRTPDRPAQSWIVLEDAGGVAASFCASLEAAGLRALRLRADESEVAARLGGLPGEIATAAVACFWPLDADAGSDGETIYAALLALLQTLGEGPTRPLVVVTSGAAGIDVASPDLSVATRGAGIAALSAAAALEYPQLGVRVVDVDPLAPSAKQAGAVLTALRVSSEPLLALRGDDILAPRLRRLPDHADAIPMEIVHGGGGLDGVALRPFTPARPLRGEVLVRVLAAGLNFRDVLVALGAYPGAPAPFGGECAGIVEAVGAGVEGFAAGDAVVCLAQGCLATHALARADLTARLPDGLRFDVAAASPVAFLTGHIGLHHIAKLRRGDTVLIHAATGGVGLAALALAQRAGAQVIATAGSPEKRAYLSRRGVEHVFDSRTPDFAEQVLAATGGKGARIALNSLTGPFVGETLRALSPGGVMIELGKRQIWTPEQVAAARPDVAYHVFDASVMAAADPTLFTHVANEILPAIARGELAPLPIEVRGLDDATGALRHMAQARHIGKLVLKPKAARTASPPVRTDAAYLITGGFGALGLRAAAWLVAQGARQLVLVGRNAPGASAREAIAALERAGARVRVALNDICNLDATRALLADVGRDAPLRGIVHAAGVAADALIRTLDAATIHEARRGKAVGARALRQATSGLPLDFVVLCSSAAGLFGGLGQGAYVAANAELEAVGTQWRRDGAPVITVAWGPWAEGGMFERLPAQAKSAWHARGLRPMPSHQALAALELLLAQDEPHAVAASADWRQLSELAPPDRRRALFEAFEPDRPASPRVMPPADQGLGQLRALSGGLQRPALIEVLAKRTRAVLELPDGVPLPAATPLKQFGLDSLMAVELRNQLARFGGVPLPATLVFDHPTLEALADRLSSVWALRPAHAIATPTSPAGDEIDGMSDIEAEALLAAELATLSAEPARGRRPQ